MDTIAYLDVSGSMTIEMILDGLRSLPADLQVRLVGDHIRHTDKTVAEFLETVSELFKNRIYESTSIVEMLHDFGASGARTAYFVSDGVFPDRESIPSNMRLVVVQDPNQLT